MNESYVSLLIQRFLIEKEKNDRGGIYALTQRMLAYNSNKIEGSTLSEEQTASLFETGTLSADGTIVRAKDVEEMTGHFLMFNEMLNTYNEPLSHELIKRYHYKLKSGVFEDLANGYPVGEYKNRRNLVSNITTALPAEVHEKMTELLEEYNSISSCAIEDIAKFHAAYEKIHPFQDGNGRTGRLIIFKECLKNGLVPLIIDDRDKAKYYDALNKAQTQNDIESLCSFFKSEQAKYYEISKDFVVPLSIKERSESAKEKADIKEKSLKEKKEPKMER